MAAQPWSRAGQHAERWAWRGSIASNQPWGQDWLAVLSVCPQQQLGVLRRAVSPALPLAGAAARTVMACLTATAPGRSKTGMALLVHALVRCTDVAHALRRPALVEPTNVHGAAGPKLAAGGTVTASDATLTAMARGGLGLASGQHCSLYTADIVKQDGGGLHIV